MGLVVVGVIALLCGARWTPEGGTVAGWATGAGGALFLLALPVEEVEVGGGSGVGYLQQALAEAWAPAWALGV